jgi:hypothetical protein
VRITAAGNVGVGTTSPSTPLHVSGGDVRVSRTASDGAIQFADADTYIYGNASTNAVTIGTSGVNRLLATDAGVEIVGDFTVTDKIIHSGDTNTAVRFPAADTFTVETSGSERFRIDSSGNALLGATATVAQAGVTSRLQVQGASAGGSSVGCIRFSNDIFPPSILIGKSRSGTVGTNTVVQNGDTIGQVAFNGADGTNYITGAAINAIVSGAPSTSDMPTALLFGTTADGQGSPAERMRIHANGDVSINSAAAGIATTVGGASWQVSGFHAIYRNSSTAAEGIVGYYSNWGATQREVTRFQVDGNILNYNNSYGALSDASIKENIEDATPKLDALKQVRVVNFNRIGDPDNKQIGMVAQELEAVWPKLISEDQDGLKSIKYSVLVPILVKAVQELAAKVEALENA